MTYLNVISFTEGGLIFVKIAIITNELFLFLSLLAFKFIVVCTENATSNYSHLIMTSLYNIWQLADLTHVALGLY